ncbi:MAG: sodium/sugar symporter [Bacteroidales bacterium]
MGSAFDLIDYIVFIVYVLMIVGIGLYVSRIKKGTERTSQDYFLASRSLKWWAIGASLIAANISAEHFIAMSGSGYRIGLGIAAYEWIAAIVLIIVGKYFLPMFLERGIYTMPQFIESRYNKSVSVAFAVFWLLVYVFVNLTSVIWLGALAMDRIMGIPLMWGILGLAVFSAVYSIYGGLKAVAWTDVVQVFFLIGGGLVTTVLGLYAVSGGEGIFQGLSVIYEKAGDSHFNMIVTENTIVPDGAGGLTDAFLDLPGLAVILGAMWLTNLGYWGFNQFIIQKGLAAENIRHAKRGLIFAGYLKILIPVIVILPGITAYVLFQHPELLETREYIGEIGRADEAYPWLLKNFVPVGIRGLTFAALVAAIVSSLSAMINSTSTIFTIDIYKPFFRRDAKEKELVLVGRIVALTALIIAVASARPLLGGLDQAFQYIQEYTGYIYPGVVVVFGMGLFWKQATARAALWTAIATIPAGIVIKIFFPGMPFILRMGYVFILLVFIASVISLRDRNLVEGTLPKGRKARFMTNTGYGFVIAGIITLLTGIMFIGPLAHLGFESIFMLATGFGFVGMIFILNSRMRKVDEKSFDINPELFKTGKAFNLGAAGIILIVGLLYYFFW